MLRLLSVAPAVGLQQGGGRVSATQADPAAAAILDSGSKLAARVCSGLASFAGHSAEKLFLSDNFGIACFRRAGLACPPGTIGTNGASLKRRINGIFVIARRIAPEGVRAVIWTRLRRLPK